MRGAIASLLAAVMFIAVPALAQEELVVFENLPDNGWFTPFDSATPAGVLYGDSGWLSDFTSDTYALTRIELGLIAQDGTAGGTTDIVFTFNDGDPSGLVFGSGAELYQTVIQDVALPSGAGPQYFTLSIDLPNVLTSGGYNNIGWSVGVENFSFDGSFGFQCSSTLGQQTGYYTNNASHNDGASWSLFSFGADPTYGVANFVATVYTPEPASIAMLAMGLLAFRRR